MPPIQIMKNATTSMNRVNATCLRFVFFAGLFFRAAVFIFGYLASFTQGLFWPLNFIVLFRGFGFWDQPFLSLTAASLLACDSDFTTFGPLSGVTALTGLLITMVLTCVAGSPCGTAGTFDFTEATTAGVATPSSSKLRPRRCAAFCICAGESE